MSSGPRIDERDLVLQPKANPLDPTKSGKRIRYFAQNQIFRSTQPIKTVRAEKCVCATCSIVLCWLRADTTAIRRRTFRKDRYNASGVSLD
ncbi:MAG: hypothetical protein Q9218_002921 [Villophora microphyllina]